MSKEETIEEFTAAYKEENPDASDEDITAAWEAKQLEGMNLTEKVAHMMDEYGKMLIKQMEGRLQVQIDAVVKDTQDELIKAIRAGVGLDEDPVIHLSEVTAVVRKMLLESKDGGGKKKTTDDEGEGPGGKPADDDGRPAFDIEKMFAEATKQRGIV